MGRPVDYKLIYELEDERYAQAKNYVCPLWAEVSDAARKMGDRWSDVPPINGTNGHVILANGDTVAGNELSGEIERCGECGHSSAFHYKDDEDWSSCRYGTYFDTDGWLCHPCNCGDNIGR